MQNILNQDYNIKSTGRYGGEQTWEETLMCGCAGGYEDDDPIPEHHVAKVRHDCAGCKAVIPVDGLYYVGKCKRLFCSVICKNRADNLKPEAILFQSGSIQ